MTITFVKVGEDGKETAVSLPNETSVKIFNLMDGPSLLRSRLVARQWNICIEEFILGTEVEDRRIKILKQQWGLAAPAMKVSQIEIGCGYTWVRAVSRKFLALDKLDWNKLSVYNVSDGVPRLLLELDGDFLSVFIDSSFLMGRSVDNRVKVLNLSSGEVTYDTDSPTTTGPIRYDKHQKSLIVGNKRIKIRDDGTVQQHIHLDFVETYSHPLYIALSPGYRYRLWKFEGGHYQHVKVLGEGYWTDFKFYTSKSAIVGVRGNTISAVHIKIWNSNTGDENYEGDLPVILPGGGVFEYLQFDIVQSAGQLVVLGKNEDCIPVVVIFQLEELMAGVVGEPRVWVLDQMGSLSYNRRNLAVDKTSVILAGWDYPRNQLKIKHLVMDFWNTKN